MMFFVTKNICSYKHLKKTWDVIYSLVKKVWQLLWFIQNIQH